MQRTYFDDLEVANDAKQRIALSCAAPLSSRAVVKVLIGSSDEYTVKNAVDKVRGKLNPVLFTETPTSLFTLPAPWWTSATPCSQHLGLLRRCDRIH